MAGRRPKPTELKKAQGNPGKRKINELEPTPEITDASVPAYLSKAARSWWEMLAPMLLRIKVLTEADHMALMMVCEYAAQAEDATKILRKSGVMEKKKLLDRNGKKIGEVPCINPAFKVQLECMKQLKSLLAEFGMSPASRAKVTKMVEPSQLKRDPLGELRDRAKRSR